MNPGVQLWYYSEKVPARAVGVAKVSVPPMTPAQLTSINNTPYEVGSLSIWKSTTGYAGAADYTAPDYNQAVMIHGDTAYFVSNQFFQLTNTVSALGNPMFYQHILPAGVTNLTILDINGLSIAAETLVSGGILYHSLDGAPYTLRYVTAAGYLQTTLLRYDPVIPEALAPATGTSYQFISRLITVGVTTAFWIRFTTPNGFQIMPMYDYLPNNLPLLQGLGPKHPELRHTQPSCPSCVSTFGT